ncbi:MAG: tRNA (N(6)-L-threonylcarbamoyladenosine(37)-C(2))-methylthiotransferase MtaB [Actinomycetota bacterium]|nr:tRNA (N(6)-L-threonylcarbamoyladenosine(37)-C(2))-methylthiotransferase MtaB [Actinomycetota bacterium]
MTKVSFTTLGCRLNQAESDSMAEELGDQGLVQAADSDPDIVVVNTCTVTREATKASRSAIRRAVKNNPDARVVVIGCYAVSNPEEVRSIEGVDAVFDNNDKERIVEALAGNASTAPLLQIGMRNAKQPSSPSINRTTRSVQVRANLKVQTGCDEWCTFCIIPTTRGPLRSMHDRDLIAEAERKVGAGARELVLTGVHLGKYSYDRGGDERRLVSLLERLLAIEGVARLRLSSIFPRHLTPELLELMASDRRMCRYLHVPLQAGDDGVLREMHRPYDVEEYRAAVTRAHEFIDGLALATDIIVGFPGETDEAFENTLRLVQELRFSKLHVFRYSARPDTPAAAMSAQIDPQIKKARSKRLIDLGNKLRREFLQDHLGRPLEILVEDRREVDGRMVCSGQTDDYVRVWWEGEGQLGSLVQVEGTAIRADGLQGSSTIVRA